MEVRRLQKGARRSGSGDSAVESAGRYPTPNTEYLERFLAKRESVIVVAIDEVRVGFAVAYMLDRIDRDQPMTFFYEIGVAESRKMELAAVV